jgi:hypothetical protein
MKALPILFTAATIAVALSGCSVTANETPCKNFESAYNSVDPGSKLNGRAEVSGDAYGDAINTLAGRIEQDARNVALGEVQKSMIEVVIAAGGYNLSTRPNRTTDVTPLEARNRFNDGIAGVAKACKDAGYPITLKADPAP